MGQVAFAATTPRSLPVLCTVPCFDETMLRSGQFRLPLRLPVIVPQERSDFLARLLARTAEPITLRPSVWAEPLHVEITPHVALKAPDAAIPPQARDNGIPITAVMLVVERIVTRAAIARHPMPSNPILGEQAGGHNRGVVARALQRLEQAGRLRIEIAHGERRIVLPDGEMTAWGQFAVGVHKPYSRTPKGAPREQKQARPDYKPDGETPFRYVVQPQRMVPTQPSPRCQYPLWEGDAKPWRLLSPESSGRYFCCEPSRRGSSYCPRHDRLSHEASVNSSS